MKPEQAKALREPFPKELIGQLPTGGVMLDFVGHAATTDRLLQVDPEWTWEPFAVDESGLPKLDNHGGLWIRLTVAGVTKPGYGDAGNKKGPNAVKEAIGDALRNAAMRFGVAIDLWSKQDLIPAAPDPLVLARDRVWAAAQKLGWDRTDLATNFAKDHANAVVGQASPETLNAWAVELEKDLAAAAAA